jgi:FAD/FMN-containing dehydrogenase
MESEIAVWNEVSSTMEDMLKEEPFEITKQEKGKIVEELRKVISPERVRAEPHICAYYRGGRYSAMTRIFAVKPPDIIVYPNSTEEVRQVLIVASKYKIPVVPVGGLTIPTVPFKGGVVLDMMSMNKIHKVDLEHNYVVIEPGVTIGQLKKLLGSEYLIAKGSYPNSFSALNPHACFGAQHSFANRMWDQVIGLEMVMADGSIIYTGSMLYGDVEHWTEVQTSFTLLKNLFLPSHGDMGVITKAAIRIWPILDKSAIFVFGFKDFPSALRWSHSIAKSPTIDQSMVYSWVATGFYGAGAALLLGLDWIEGRANYDQDNPPPEISPFPYYAFIQTRGYSEEVDGTLKAAQRLAKHFGGIYLSEEELLKKPLIGGWYTWLVCSYLAKSVEEVSKLVEAKASPEFKKLYFEYPKNKDVIAIEAPVLKAHFTGPVNEIIRFYDSLKKKLKELGWENFSCYSRMFHYGQTPWFAFWPFIDAYSPENAKKTVKLLTSITKWALDNYRINVQRAAFILNNPHNPSDVYERAKPVRRLLRAIQKEFDPASIMNPLAQKYTLS